MRERRPKRPRADHARAHHHAAGGVLTHGKMDSSFVYVLSKHPLFPGRIEGVLTLYTAGPATQWPFPSAPESARTFPKVLEMQRAKRCPQSPSLCFTLMGILVGLAGYAAPLFIGRF